MNEFVVLIADLVKFCFPFSFVFGLTAKLYKMTMNFIFDRKVDV